MRQILKPIITKLREYMIKLFPRMKYEYCYTDMEYKRVAVFGLCNGCNDSNCPFYCNTDDKE